MHLNSAESKTGPTMNAHDFINYELEFDLINHYIPIEEEILDMLDESDDAANNDSIEEASTMQIGDAVVDKVGSRMTKVQY